MSFLSWCWQMVIPRSVEELSYCMFCNSPMKRHIKYDNYYQCSNYTSHREKQIWARIKQIDTNFYCVNIRCDGYQFCFDLEKGTTQFLFIKDNHVNKAIITFDYIIDLELDENYIRNKMHTIVTYM
jgi:hypothetical protein